nr:hypothetical protein [Tanacetum cinerariifolium]
INNKDVLVDGKEHDDNIHKSVSLDIHSSSSGALTRNQGDKTENKDKGKSHVVTIIGFRDLNEEFEECINNSSNGANAASSSVSAAGLNFTNITNDFSAAGPSNTAASPLVENSALQNVSTSSHYVDMPNLEDYTHSDNADDTMNYHPVLTENQSNSTACFQDTEKAGEEGTHTYSVSLDIHSSSCGDQAKEQGDKAMNKDKGKSPVVTIIGFRDLNEEFADCINNSSNGVSAAGPSVFAAGLEFTNNANDFTTAGPLVFTAELNFTNSTNDFSAAGPSNAAMPNLKDFSHNEDNVGAEANTNNMESIISVSPIPTTRIHKDHPTS